MKRNTFKNERGFTLLEYCAGAAIMIGVVYMSLSRFGGELSGLFGQLEQWSSRRSSVIKSTD